jgi:ankyrin repeat protein
MAPLNLGAHDLASRCRLLDAARDGHTELVTQGIRFGLPVDLSTDTGDTLLILAAYHDRPETVTELLRLGADPRVANDQGQTALTAAVFRHSAATVEALLAHGAGPAPPDYPWPAPAGQATRS